MLSDHDLLALICERDSEAFEVLSDRYRTLVYRHVVNIVHNDDAAEDVVQEVFLRIWLRAAQWNEQGSFKAWLFRIATNLALNHLRTVRRRKQQPLELPPEVNEEGIDNSMPDWMIDTSAAEPDLLLVQRERSQLLQQLIEGLPPEKREVFRLVHDAEMEIRQVAEFLAIPTGTVKSRLHYASKRIAREWVDLIGEWEETQ